MTAASSRGGTGPDSPAGRAARAEGFVVAAALALGVALRLRLYLANRSLWLDEAYLALNLIERDFAGLLLPLAYNQAAPVGFLFVERLMVVLFGAGEYALRAFPLAGAIAALLVFWRLAAMLLSPVGVMVAVTGFAVSEPLVYYATEAKQYGIDATVTVLLWTAFVVLAPSLRRDDGRLWAVAGAIGAAAVWLSHPAVFVLGGIGLRWLWETLRHCRWRSVLVRGPVGLVWVASFALAYFVALSPISEGTSLHRLWESAAAPVVPSTDRDLRWYIRWAWVLGTTPLGRAVPERLLALVLAAGAAALWLRHRDLFWWMSGAMALAWVASALGSYPLASRLWVFFAPIGILLVAAAIDEVSRRARPRFALLAPALAVLILAPPTLAATRQVVAPPGKEEIRPLLQHVRDRYREGDTLYVYYGAVPATLYYAARGLGFPGPVVMEVWWNRRADLPLEAETLPGKGRVWVLFSHVRRSRGVDDEAATLERLDRFGTRLEQKRETGAVVYLYAL